MTSLMVPVYIYKSCLFLYSLSMLFLISIGLLTILTMVVCVQVIAIRLSDSDTRHLECISIMVSRAQ